MLLAPHGAKCGLGKEHTAGDSRSPERLVSSGPLCGAPAQPLSATHALVRWVHAGKRGSAHSACACP